jgi:DNA polymerase-3 subunit alpha
MSNNFVHLHVHSQYSILDACPAVEDLAERAAKNSMPAVALTDHGNLFGAVEFYKACKDAKVKPIIGCELYLASGSRHDRKRISGIKNDFHITILAKNMQGYKNLCKLSSIGYLEGFYYSPRIDQEVLAQHKEGLICLSGCMSSMISQEILTGTPDNVIQKIEWFRQLFGEDFYLEIMRHEMSSEDIESDKMHEESWLIQHYQDYLLKQNKINSRIIELSRELNIPLVATNDSHYLDREDWRAHEIILNIQSGEPTEIVEKDSLGNPKFRVPNPKRRAYPSHECYFKTADQMAERFQDIPEAISNTLLVAEKCHVELDFKTKHYPVYTPPALKDKTYTKEEQVKAVESYLWELCEKGIPLRYTPERLSKVKEHFPNQEPMDVVRKRLEYEMSIIVPKGMSDYLLIVWDFIHWAKTEGIPMGPGRGSGAGSIVLYLIGVTDIEPLRFSLFFERFINPERISYPDIDVDICMDRRGDVINYVLNKYGKDNVAQIITFGTMKARMTIKDVGRVLNVPLTKVNAIVKLVPDDLDITLDKALEKDPELRALAVQDEDARRILEIGKKLEGSIRNTGIHAAGIIICGEPLTHYIPLCNAKDSDMAATQFSMKPVEMVGMLKMDFLGLTTLTCIQKCIEAIQSNTGRHIDWINLPLDDKPTFDLLNKGRTMGVFQLESGGMQELARNLHLDKFEEIIAVGALYRPGPMDMIPSFINRKHGREPIENDHPWMREILAETYGIMVYQEQVMQIASKLAKYTLGEGDVLRRAMGKKDAAQMAKEREKFRQGSLANNIDEKTSMLIFDKMEKFASYGFNKSHAAAYGYLTYVTAFLKANYPREWLASLLTCVRDDITKVTKFIRECQAMAIPVLPPNVNESGEDFNATSEGVRFAITGIKGIGEGVVEAMLQERKKNGPFLDLYNFIKRIDTKKVGKKSIENLIEAGCFDFTGWPRDALKASVEPMYETASREQKDSAAGIMSLFGRLGESKDKHFKSPPQNYPKVSKQEQLHKEKELLGFFLTGHPLNDHKPILRRLSCVNLSDVEDMAHDNVFRSAFILESVDVKISNKNQKKFAIVMISDGYERYEMPIWPEMYEQKSHLLRENQLLYAVLQVDKKGEATRVVCKWFDDLTRADDKMIEECDRIFDKSKHFISRMSSFSKTKDEKAKDDKTKDKPNVKMEIAPMISKIVLTVDADVFNLSHVLALKGLFAQNRGPTPVNISFHGSGKELAVVHIDSKWGVSDNKDLEAAIKNITGVLSLAKE